MRYNRLLRGARSVEQIVAKLDPSRADILLSQLRPAILQPAYILIRDRVERVSSSSSAARTPSATPSPRSPLIRARTTPSARTASPCSATRTRVSSARRGGWRKTPETTSPPRRRPTRGSNSRSSGTASAPAPPCSSRNSFASSRGRSRAEPLRGRRVPRVRVSVVSLQGTERELPTVHHHRRLQRGRRPARQFQ